MQRANKKSKYKKQKLKPLTPVGKGALFTDLPEWDDEFLDVARYYGSKGMGNRQIAAKFHVPVSTIDHWMKTKPDFRDAVKLGKEEITQEIENAFAQSAIGYSHPDVQVYVYRGKTIIVPITKHYPPNAYAAYKWLVNNARDRWNDTSKIEKTTNVNIVNRTDLSDFSNDELKALEKVGINKLVENAGKSLN